MCCIIPPSGSSKLECKHVREENENCLTVFQATEARYPFPAIAGTEKKLCRSSKGILDSTAFVPSLPLLSNHRQAARCKQTTPRCSSSSSTSSLPRIVVLPGMDGTGLLLEKFRESTCTSDDPNRVIPVDYPVDKTMTVSQLGDFVMNDYLKALATDDRGYVLVNQSFSGHVGFHLSQQSTPGLLRGQVFVNAFASTPAPSFLRYIPDSLANSFFRNQPPASLVGRIFLGKEPIGMEKVQSAASQVEPFVMTHRLSLCLTENNWHVWRRQDLLPGNRTLYLRGDDDVILRSRDANRIKMTRPDIEWVHIPGGPHLLLQKHGTQCGQAVNKFCTRLDQDIEST